MQQTNPNVGETGSGSASASASDTNVALNTLNLESMLYLLGLDEQLISVFQSIDLNLGRTKIILKFTQRI